MKYARIELRIGEVAIDRLRERITGHEDSILLAVEKVLKHELGLDEAGDPYSDPRGIFVDDFEVEAKAGYGLLDEASA